MGQMQRNLHLLKIKPDMPQTEKESEFAALREVAAGYATASKLLCCLGHVQLYLQYEAPLRVGQAGSNLKAISCSDGHSSQHCGDQLIHSLTGEPLKSVERPNIWLVHA